MTFSLIGRCAATGMLGGVIATSSPAVGSRCLFTRAGVGAVLTQHWTDPRLGPRGLALLEAGVPAAYAAAALMQTSEKDYRQVAVLDVQGRTAYVTGEKVKGAQAGADGVACVAIGNILANTKVVLAMVDAFEDTPGQLPERLLRALEAGFAAGGEVRPLVSAAMQVANTAPFPYVDLRVDVSSDPIADLRGAWDVFRPEADAITGRAMRPREMPQGSLVAPIMA